MQTLTEQEYRGMCELADARLDEFHDYWFSHPYELCKCLRYTGALANSVLKFNRDGVKPNVPPDLRDWPSRFADKIRIFKNTASLFDLGQERKQFFSFASAILRHIQPSCSRALNALQLAEIDYVIRELGHYKPSRSSNRLLEIAEKERAILSEDCNSYYANCRLLYLREMDDEVLSQDLFSRRLRLAYWDKICFGVPDSGEDDEWQIKGTRDRLEKLPDKTMTDEERLADKVLFLNELLNDIRCATSTRAEEPRELPRPFREGIGLLVRCNQVEFLMHCIEAVYEDLCNLCKSRHVPVWAPDRKKEVEEIRKETQALMMPMAVQRDTFSLFGEVKK